MSPYFFWQIAYEIVHMPVIWTIGAALLVAWVLFLAKRNGIAIRLTRVILATTLVLVFTLIMALTLAIVLPRL